MAFSCFDEADKWDRSNDRDKHMDIISINDKNCSLSIVLTATH